MLCIKLSASQECYFASAFTVLQEQMQQRKGRNTSFFTERNIIDVLGGQDVTQALTMICTLQWRTQTQEAFETVRSTIRRRTTGEVVD